MSVSMRRCVYVCGESEREIDREREKGKNRCMMSVYVVLLDAATFGVLRSLLNLKTRLKSGVTFMQSNCSSAVNHMPCHDSYKPNSK